MKRLLTLLALITVGLGFTPLTVSAQTDAQCQQAIQGCSDVQIDFKCQRDKLVDPDSPCCVQYCGNVNPNKNNREAEKIDWTLFNVRFSLDSDKAVAQVLFIVFNLFLAVVAMYAVFVGVYASVQRAQADSEEKVAATIKQMRNAIIGLVLIGLSLLIAQLIASLLGLGSVAELTDFSGLF